MFEDISSAINGFARIVTYANHSIPEYTDVNNPLRSGMKVVTHQPEHLEIMELTEGEFKEGKLNGYGRRICARTGTCEVGFFQDGVPMGKYTQYAADGSFLLDEGIYEGYGPHGLVRKAKIEIATYMAQISKPKNKKL